MENFEVACDILEKQYEACEVVKLDTEQLKRGTEGLSEMATNELLDCQIASTIYGLARTNVNQHHYATFMYNDIIRMQRTGSHCPICHPAS